MVEKEFMIIIPSAYLNFACPDLILTLLQRTYHDYIIDQGSKYTKPDLAVAFDSGCSQEDIESWKKSYKALHQRNIPSVFTVSVRIAEPENNP